MDSDVAWLRPFDVRTVVKGAPGQPDTIRYKYPLSSRDSGAYEGDIDFGANCGEPGWLAAVGIDSNMHAHLAGSVLTVHAACAGSAPRRGVLLVTHVKPPT